MDNLFSMLVDLTDLTQDGQQTVESRRIKFNYVLASFVARRISWR